MDVRVELMHQLDGNRSRIREHLRPSLGLKKLHNSRGLLPNIYEIHDALLQRSPPIEAVSVLCGCANFLELHGVKV